MSVTPANPDDERSLRDPLIERFPQLADIGSMDDDRRIDALRGVLDDLQHELDAIGSGPDASHGRGAHHG